MKKSFKVAAIVAALTLVTINYSANANDYEDHGNETTIEEYSNDNSYIENDIENLEDYDFPSDNNMDDSQEDTSTEYEEYSEEN